MKRLAVTTAVIAGILLAQIPMLAQFNSNEKPADVQNPIVITLEQALEIALSENISVKVADMEIERTGYAKKGAYAALFPQIDLSGAYQRTIKKQVMYMDIDMSSIMGGAMGGETGGSGAEQLPEDTESSSSSSSSSGGGMEYMVSRSVCCNAID